MKILKETIKSSANSITYTHFSQDSDRICFMFSGTGYRYDKPIFYYATQLMIQEKIDVVHVHYSYDDTIFDFTTEEISEKMMEDIQPVLTKVLSSAKYTDVIFLTKSLGTVPTLSLLKEEQFKQATFILLTPLMKKVALYEAILHSDRKMALMIGDRDPHFDARQLETLQNKNLPIEVISGANHSLELIPMNTSASVEVIKDMIDWLHSLIK